MKQATVERWPKSARRMSYSKDYAGGETMGSMDAAWWARILEAMDPEIRAAREANRIVWHGIDYPRRPHELPGVLRAPPPCETDPLRIVNRDTGEILPVPFSS